MAKKQIKELRVKTSSPGAAQTAKELRAVVTAMERAENQTSEFTKQITQSSSSLTTMAKDLSAVSRAVDRMSSSIGQGTKSTEKGFEALMDNLELTTLYMRDLASESTKVSANLQGLGSHHSLEGVENALRDLLPLLEQMGMDMEESSIYTEIMAKSSQETVLALDRLSDRIVEVEDAAIGGVRATKELGDVIGGVGERSKTSGVQVNKYTNDVRRLSGAGSQSARAFSDLAFKMNPLVSIYAKIAVNVYALTSAFRVLNTAANLKRLTEETAKFSASITGIDVTYLSKQIQEISGNAISTGQALKLAISGISFGFTTEQMERLTLATRKASIATGTDFGDSLDRVISGIAKMEGQALNAVGVVTQVETAVKKWAAANNRVVSSLTDLERQTAFAEEALRQMEEKYGSMDPDTTGFEKLGVAVQNLVDNVMMASGGAFGNLAARLADLVSGLSGVKSAWDDVASSKKVYEEALRTGNVAQARIAQIQHAEALIRVRKEQEKGTTEYDKYQESLKNAAEAQEVLNTVMAAGTVIMAVWASIKLVSVIKTVVVVMGKLAVAGGKVLAWVMRIARPLALAASLFAAVAGVPLWGAVAAVVAIGAAVTGVGIAAYKTIEPFRKFVDFIRDFAVKWIGKSMDYVKDKVSATFGWIVDSINKMTGLGKVTDSLTSVSGASVGVSDATMTMGSSISSIQTSIDEYNKSLLTTDDLMAKLLNKSKDKNFLFQDIPKSLTHIELLITPEIQEPKRYNPERGWSVWEEFLISEEGAKETLKYAGEISAAMEAISSATGQMRVTITPLDNFMSKMNILAKVPKEIGRTRIEFNQMQDAFDNLLSNKEIPEWMEFDMGRGLTKSRDLLREFYDDYVHYVKFFESEIEVFNFEQIAGDPGAALASMTKQLNEQERIYNLMMSNTGPVILEQEKEKVRIALEVLKAERDRLALTTKFNMLNKETSNLRDRERLDLEYRTELETKLLAFDIESLEMQIRLGTEHKMYVGDLERELAVLQRTLGVAEATELVERNRMQLSNRRAEAEARAGQAGTRTSEVAIRQEVMNLRMQEYALMKEGLAKEEELLLIKREQAELDRQKLGALSKDAASVFKSISGMTGLSELQNVASTSLGSVMDVVGDFQSRMGDSSQSFFEFLKGDIEAFGNVAKAGLDLAQSLFADSSKAKVDAIDREIAAEERRDGKSEESQAKIRALQAKKIKEEGKAQKASIMMSTASAIMQVMSQMPFPANLAVAAGYAAMGAMQMSQIDKAMNGQLAGLGGGAKSMSFSTGRPDNNVDVSKSASAGEYSHLNNFTPGRAVGNFAAAGTSIVVGESGPEEITPALPVNVSSAGREGSGSTIVFQPIFHNNTVDAAGMEELMQTYSRQLYDGLETELRARNKTLDNL